MPLAAKALAQHQWQQFPLISGGMVIVINLPNIKNNQLILDGRTLAAIYAGKITHWDDPRIVKLNPQVKLPHVTINVLHRADGSGTTYNFTHYLAQVSPSWKQHIGFGTTVAWPVGIGAKGNSGVAMFAQRVIGSIGYVEYSYAKLTKLNTVRMKNSAGNIVSPTPQTFQAAAKNARWHAVKNYNILLTNQPGKNSWPLVATTFVLLPTHPKNIAKQKALITFLKWCYVHGTSSARKLDYVPLPNNTVHL